MHVFELSRFALAARRRGVDQCYEGLTMTTTHAKRTNTGRAADVGAGALHSGHSGARLSVRKRKTDQRAPISRENCDVMLRCHEGARGDGEQKRRQLSFGLAEHQPAPVPPARCIRERLPCLRPAAEPAKRTRNAGRARMSAAERRCRVEHQNAGAGVLRRVDWRAPRLGSSARWAGHSCGSARFFCWLCSAWL